MTGIYKITNIINNKIYIGQSINIEERFSQHKKSYLQPYSKHYNCLIYRAFRKYGLENFRFEILEECKIEELSKKESFWIKYYNSYYNGYNMTFGGEGCTKTDYNKIAALWEEGYNLQDIVKITEMNKVTISKALHYLGITPKEIMIRGSCHKTKSVEQYSLEGKFLHRFSSVTQAASSLLPKKSAINIIKACKGQITSAYGFLWKYSNDSTKIECLVDRAAEKIHHGKRKVGQYSLNGEFLRAFDSVKEAAFFIKTKSSSSITNACTGRSKTSGGFIWRYMDN